ncbi:MAG: DUF1592 domain-containing protein [Acidobacteriota bacterium]|nr:MAG: DUF1592 domain-containing protein [Acidobacteriota bacterium]
MRLRAAIVVAVAGSALFAVLPGRSARQSPSQDSFDRVVRAFIVENCAGCHSADLKSGELDLDSFKTAQSVIEHRETWEQVSEKIRSGEMPPKGIPRPDPESIKAVIHWLELEFERADRMIKPDPGSVTARRLNRAEYNNTVRDLLGVDLRPADDFPQDDSGYGFDNIGDVLSLPPVLMEKYLTAAERVARQAVLGPEALKPTLHRPRTTRGRIEPSTKPLHDYDKTGLSLPHAVHFRHRFPVTAEYNLRAFLGGVRPLGSAPLKLGLWIDGKLDQALEFDPVGVASFSDDVQDFGGMTRDFRAQITAGDHWIAVTIMNLYEGLPVSYGGPNPSTRPLPPPPVFKPPKNLPPERVERIRKLFEERLARVTPANQARVSNVEVGGPYNQVLGPSRESLEKIYSCGHFDRHHTAACGRTILSSLTRRAWRRPVEKHEVEKLHGLVTAVQKNGDSFEEGLVVAIQAMLVSPHFLFRIEQDRQASAEAAPIGQYELASRLSYFLWSSMPDAELFRAAERGTLRRPDVLEAQIRRMLEDPKSSALIENFGGQWLELRKLESFKPDPERFPQYDEYLRMSMRSETELFFENIVRRDLSLIDFIDAGYSFLNQRLADFYGIPGVSGPEFRQVSLDRNSQRGGILTHASVLSVSSYTTRTSPVLRGKWILENILNAPPPPPPPDVPNLDDSKVGATASLRQQLEEHRKNTVCAACHSRMDPLGFGLENYNAIGAWRTMDGKLPIDSSGVLPDGRKFNGPAELRSILVADRHAFAEGLSEKLLTYALGRGLERYDKPVLRQISKQLAADDYRFSSLVLGIVKSLPFQNRRTMRN